MGALPGRGLRRRRAERLPLDAPAPAHGHVDGRGLATGGEFADALAGGAFVARLGGPLLLTGTDGLPELVRDYLETNAETIDEAFIFGGTHAISDVVADEVDQAIDG